MAKIDMPISRKYQVIFVHIPKTGGTSIEVALSIAGDSAKTVGIKPLVTQTQNYETLFGNFIQHMKAWEIRNFLGDELYNSYFKFVFVRNPWARLVSELAWKDGLWADGSILSKEMFEHRLHNWHKECKVGGMDWSYSDGEKIHLVKQVNFIFDNRRRSLVDFIGSYENLAADWDKICEQIGEPIPLPYRMKSNHLHYTHYYTNKTRKIVEQLYKDDIECFNYVFGK